MEKVKVLIVVPKNRAQLRKQLEEELRERYSYTEITIQEDDNVERATVRTVEPQGNPEPTGVATAEGMQREVSRIERSMRK
jgi:hypothetical protein